MIAAITSGGSKVDKMVVAVLKDDPAETLEDASDYEFGVQFNTGAENMKAAAAIMVPKNKNTFTPRAVL